MWPYRPWLFKAQNPGRVVEDDDMQGITSPESQSYDQSRPLPQSQSMTTAQSQPVSTASVQSRQQPLLQPQPISHSQSQSQLRRQPVRDWARRYRPTLNSRVYGYPSTGGVLILPGYDIDLPYLGLQKDIEARRSPNIVEEEAFCRRLRYLGAIWWPYPDADLDAMRGQGSSADAQRASMHVCVGWLANGGGVWVLKYSENDDENDLSLKAQRLGSLDMNARCRMIEQLGGKYYRHPEECEDLRWGNWPVLR